MDRQRIDSDPKPLYNTAVVSGDSFVDMFLYTSPFGTSKMKLLRSPGSKGQVILTYIQALPTRHGCRDPTIITSIRTRTTVPAILTDAELGRLDTQAGHLEALRVQHGVWSSIVVSPRLERAYGLPGYDPIARG
jgi:hypothetical protein